MNIIKELRILEEYNTHWLAQGLARGYPNCCIKAFILQTDLSTIIINGKTNCSGFRPCNKCAKKVINGEIKLKDLILPTRSKVYPKFKEIWVKI